MASIYDFAPSNTESVKNTDFSTNYGFNVIPNALGIPYEQDFSEGLYAYANAHKSPDMLKRAQTTFGKNLVNKEYADFWVGDAIINQLQFPDITSAYIATGIPIPEGITDINQLTSTLGRNILDKLSKDYDTHQQTLATTAERVAANYQKLLNATYQPSDLTPQHFQEIVDAYGYSPHDIYAAGRILALRQNKSTLDTLAATASSLGNAALTTIPRAGEALGAAIKGDFSQAAKRLLKSGARIEKNLDASAQYFQNATASNLANDAKFLALANNPTHALNLAQSIFAQKEKERLASITMLGRLFDKADEIIYDTYQSVADTAVTTAGLVDHTLGNTPVDIRQSQRVAAAMRDAKESARAEIQNQNGILGTLEAGVNFTGEIARFANPYSAVPAVASLFRDNAGRSFNTVADPQGNIPSSTSALEVYGKASADAAINYATRAIGMKSVPLLMNRGLTKLGVNSTLGHYLGTTAWTGLNFAATVPAMDAGLRAAYDAVAVKDERLKNGYQSLQQLWNQDLPSLDHWLTSIVPAAIFGYTGTRNYYRAGLGIATKAQMSGLTPAEADSIRRSSPLEDQPHAIQQAITTKLQQNPQKTIEDAIANTKRIASEEEQKTAAQLGKRILLDNARKSALQLRGLDITPGKDDNHISLLLGGHIDPVTAKYIPGTKTIELTKENAQLYLGAIFNHSASNLASKIRNVFVRGKLIDAAQQNLQGQILIEAMLDPADFSQIVQKGQQAEARIQQITKDLIEKSKNQDGKPSLSEADARSQAEKTIDTSISPHPLNLQATFGKEAAARIEQEAKQTRTQDPDVSFMTHAYVLTLNPNAPADSRTRIFKIAYDASAREMTEEYAEQWLKDYMETTGADLTDTYRALADLSATVKDFNLTSLQERAPQLHNKLQNGQIIDNLDYSEIRELRRDITESFSKLLLADLRSLAQQGSLPDFAQELYDTQELTLHTMEAELAYATAINDSRKYGTENQTALRLLGTTVDEVSRILKSIAPPTKDTYTQAFLEAEQTYQNLLNNNGLTSEQIETLLAQRAKDAQDIAKQIKASDEERNATAIQAVKTAEALPENADKPHNQIVKEVNEKINADKAQEIQESPAAQDDSASSNGKALQITDENGLVCHQAIVRIADLHLMPNFKTGSSEDTGEVHALTGDYHPDHDPIRILRRTDGTLMVISGRHRLAHAKRFNQETIAAYIYAETPEHNLAWAQLKDVEWNIKDNQATAQDIALLIRGELIDGVPSLNSKDMLQMGIIGENGSPRKGTNAQQGYNVATQASEDVITALKNGQIDINQAEKLAISAPSDPYLQRIGLKAMLDGKSDRIATHEIDIEKDKLAYLKDQGVALQLDLFGESELDSTYDSFIKDYSFKKVNLLNRTIAAQKTADKIAKDKDFAQLAQGTGLRIDNAMRTRSQKLKNKPTSPQEQLFAWQHPYTNMDIIGDEINTAFAKAHPDEWAKMQARKAEQQAALDAIPADSDTPDLGNSVQGDTSNIAQFDFSLIGLHASAHNFRKFSTAYMGTGEGAQAYGWGLYFAENPKINRAYFHQFNKEHTTLAYQQDGERIQESDYLSILYNIFVKHATPKYPANVLVNTIKSLMGGKFIKNWNINSEIVFLQQRIKNGQTDLQPLLDSLQEIKDKNLTIALIQEFATNYKVELNCSKEDLLSWDEGHVPFALLQKWHNYCKQNFPSQKHFPFAPKANGKLPKISGENFYRNHLQTTLGSDKAASLWLLDHGYKGIKHVDAASRSPKVRNKTHNFIIFNDADIKVTAVNETGKWSITEGWKSYTDPTADFSVAGLQSWQLDPTLGLGSLGHFADNILGKFAPVGEDLADKQLSRIVAYLKRRQREIQNMHDSKDTEILLAELQHLPQIVNLLPQGYRFGLEPYIEFLTTYANLIRNADPEQAGKALPMHNWDKHMANSFKRMFNRILSQDMLEMEQAEFEALYSPFLSLLDINKLKQALEDAREEAGLKFDYTNADKPKTPELAQHRRAAQRKAELDTMESNKDIVDTIMRAIGQIRATRLVDKLLARVYLKIDQYRKDRTLAKINRALYSITPTKSKDSKPSRGTVSIDTYNTILTNYRLLSLTKAQKDSFELANPNLIDKAPSDTISVPSYDENGSPITLNVTLQQYETYASIDSMSADQAAKTAETLGTLIATGKEAWQLQAEAETQQITNFTQPIYNKYSETSNQRTIRHRQEKLRIGAQQGFSSAIKRILTGALNDAQLIDTISQTPALKQFRSIQESIARAHSYIETAEKQNAINTIKAALTACGHPDADPLNLTPQQLKTLKNFTNNINKVHTLTGDKAITLTTQAPDFTKRHTETLRASFIKRIFQVTRKKNHDPHELAAALRAIKQDIPSHIFQEAWDKYASKGNPDLYFGDIDTAINNTLPKTKFGHLRNLKQTIQDRAAESHQKWLEENPPTSESLTSLTRNEAAYRVLLCQQTDLAESLRQQGYTPQVIQQLIDFAGEDMMQFAYTLRNILNSRLPLLKEIYETTYGTPFPEVENYFRAFFDAKTKESNDAQLEGLAFGAGGKQSGGMRLFHTRIKHKTPIMPTMSVTHAFQIGMKQQDNLIAYSDPHTHRHLGDFLNKIINHRQGNQHLIDSLHNAIGKEATSALQEHIQNMYRVYGHADAFSSAANRLISDTNTAASLALLTARLTSLGKNIVAVFNTLGGADISPLQWYKSFTRWLTPTAKLIRKPSDFLKDPIITDRFKEWDTETYLQSIYQLANQKSTLGTLNKHTRRALSIFGKFDRWATSKSAAICYDAAYRDMQKQHPDMSPSDLHNYAQTQVALALGVKGQPLDYRQRPLASTHNSWLTASYYFLGGEAWSTFGDCARLAIKSLFTKNIPPQQRRRALSQLAAVWLTNGAVMSMLNLGFNYLLDDEEQWEKRSVPLSFILGTLSGPISGIAILSNIANETFRQIDSNFYLPTPSHLPMADIGRTVREIKTLFDSDKSAWDKTIGLNNILRTLCFTLILGTQRPTSNTSALTQTGALAGAALSNTLDFLFRLARAADERLLTPVPEKPKKGVKMSKQSRDLNKRRHKSNADDNHPINLLTR